MKYPLDLSETNVLSSLKERGDFNRAIDLALFGEPSDYDFFPFDDYLKFIEGSKVLWSLGTETPNKSLGGFWGSVYSNNHTPIDQKTFYDFVIEDRGFSNMSVGKVLNWGIYGEGIFPFNYEDFYYLSAKLLFDETEKDFDNYKKILLNSKLGVEYDGGKLVIYYEVDE